MTFLSKNINLLRNRFPGLAEELENVKPDSSVIEVIEAKNGMLTGLYNGNYLHSKYKPDMEAIKYLSQINTKKKICAVFEGIGFGYLVSEFIKQRPESAVILILPDIKLFHYLLTLQDFSGILLHNTLIILPESPSHAVNSILPEFRDLEIMIMKNASVSQKFETYFTELDEIIYRFTSRRDINNYTLKKFGKLWLRNLIANYSSEKFDSGIDLFQNCLKDKTALVLAAGPSLDDHRKEIKKMSSDVVLICVDSAVNYCSQLNIKPDFIITVDPQFYNSRHLDFLYSGDIFSDSVLIAESSTCSRSIRRYNGFISIGASFFPMGQYFDKKLGIKKKLGAGGSVATSAWDFARFLGCSSIIMGGLDLGYINNHTHYKGSYFENAVYASNSRCSTMDSLNLKITQNGDPMKVVDFNGNFLKSDRRLNVYQWWFENQCEMYSHISTYSLDKRSTFIKGFKTFDQLPEVNGINEKSKIIQALLVNTFSNKNINSNFNELISVLKKLKNDCTNALRIIGNREFASRNEYNRMLQTLNSLDEEIMAGKYNQLISYLLQEEIRNTAYSSKDPLKKSADLYKSIKNACSFYLENLNRYFSTI